MKCVISAGRVHGFVEYCDPATLHVHIESQKSSYNFSFTAITNIYTPGALSAPHACIDGPQMRCLRLDYICRLPSHLGCLVSSLLVLQIDIFHQVDQECYHLGVGGITLGSRLGN